MGLSRLYLPVRFSKLQIVHGYSLWILLSHKCVSDVQEGFRIGRVWKWVSTNTLNFSRTCCILCSPPDYHCEGLQAAPEPVQLRLLWGGGARVPGGRWKRSACPDPAERAASWPPPGESEWTWTIHRQKFNLKDFSAASSDQRLLSEQLAAHMPARTEGYPWHLVYSTAVHGSSLKTLYRNMAGLDSPVLLVIKDMHKQVGNFVLLVDTIWAN